MKTKNLIKYLDYFYLTRPILFIPGWNTLLAGYLVVTGQNRFSLPGELSLDWFLPGQFHLMVGMAAFMAAMAGSFILNQLQDVESDRKNKKLFLIGENHISVKAAWAESLFLLAAALVLTAWLNHQALFLMAIFILITGYLYNFPPFEFKNRPLWGLILNALMGWIAFALGWVLLKDLNLPLLLASLPYLFFNTALYFLTTVPDARGDQDSNKHTFCVRYGIHATILASICCFILAVFAGFLTKDVLLLTIVGLSLPWFLRLLINRTVGVSIRALKMGIFFFSIIICIKFPAYFLLMLLLFLLTRMYYRQRFQFDYPNFKGE